MIALSIIMGVLLIITGVSAIFTPVLTFLSAGYFITILMFVYGLMGLIKAFQKKSDALHIVVSILAIIVGIVAMMYPGSTLLVDAMLLYFAASWFLFRGIIAVVASIQTKGVIPGWYWGLIIGILNVILGIYSFVHPGVMAITTGLLIGFYFMEAGIDMIIVACAVDKVKDVIADAAGAGERGTDNAEAAKDGE